MQYPDPRRLVISEKVPNRFEEVHIKMILGDLEIYK